MDRGDVKPSLWFGARADFVGRSALTPVTLTNRLICDRVE